MINDTNNNSYVGIGINKNRVDTDDLNEVYRRIRKGYKETLDQIQPFSNSGERLIPTKSQMDELKIHFNDLMRYY